MVQLGLEDQLEHKAREDPLVLQEELEDQVPLDRGVSQVHQDLLEHLDRSVHYHLTASVSMD